MHLPLNKLQLILFTTKEHNKLIIEDHLKITFN